MKKGFLSLFAVLFLSFVLPAKSINLENCYMAGTGEWKVKYDNRTFLGHDMYVYYGHWVLYENGRIIEEKPDHCYKIVNEGRGCYRVCYNMKRGGNTRYCTLYLRPNAEHKSTLNGSDDRITKFTIESYN